MSDLMAELRADAAREVLKYHVGHDIFCPLCDAVMDYRRAVEVDAVRGDKLLRTAVFCSRCFDAKVRREIAAGAAKLAEGGVEIRVTDGRVM